MYFPPLLEAVEHPKLWSRSGRFYCHQEVKLSSQILWRFTTKPPISMVIFWKESSNDLHSACFEEWYGNLAFTLANQLQGCFFPSQISLICWTDCSRLLDCCANPVGVGVMGSSWWCGRCKNHGWSKTSPTDSFLARFISGCCRFFSVCMKQVLVKWCFLLMVVVSSRKIATS